jgi:transposase InsO family protein
MVIKESKVNLSIQQKCAVLGINRSSYYKWLNSKSEEIDPIEVRIKEIYHKYKGTYGRHRITQKLKNLGFTVNHKKVYRIMRKLGLKSVIRKKYCRRKYVKENTAPNILKRDFKSTKPLKRLVCDVTELRAINGKRYYLYSIMDLYNNAIVAANVSFHNNWGLVQNGLNKLRLKGNKAIIHSDQGSQFVSNLYKTATAEKKLTISMSRPRNCYDNAAKESFFGHFKEEFYIFYNPRTQEELYQNIQEFIDYYNNERIQMRFKMSPMQYLKAQTSSFN